VSIKEKNINKNRVKGIKKRKLKIRTIKKEIKEKKKENGINFFKIREDLQKDSMCKRKLESMRKSQKRYLPLDT